MSEKQTLLITGGTGLIGSRFIGLSQDTFIIHAPSSKDLSVTRKETIVHALEKYKPDWVINFAAFTDVSGAERERNDETGQCWQINVVGAENIGQACKEAQVPVVHISTDYVFSGENGPYSEEDSPIETPEKGTWYGWTKRVSERKLSAILGNNLLVVRPSFPFRASFSRKQDFIASIITRLRNHSLYPMFTDQYITPTFIDDLCRALKVLIENEARGIYHITNGQSMSPFELTKLIAQTFGFDMADVRGTSRDEFLERQKENIYASYRYVKNTSLKIDKLNSFLKVHNVSMQNLTDALEEMKSQLVTAPVISSVPQRERVLLTGGSSLLGLGILDQAPKGVLVIPTYNKNKSLVRFNGYDFVELDITHNENVGQIFEKYNPTVIIHAASLGNVDYCEQHPDEADAVNVEGTKHMADAANKYQAKMIFISSNAIYDGLNAPYDEQAPHKPMNYYGKTKVRGEEYIKHSLPARSYAIVRLLLMYGWNHAQERANPVTWLLEKLKNNEAVNMVNDTYNNPLLNTQAAQAIWQIILKQKSGIFQVAGKNRINRYEFAKETAQVFGYNQNMIKSVSSDFFKGLAQRMPDTTFVTTRMEKELGITPMTTEQGLVYMRNHPVQF